MKNKVSESNVSKMSVINPVKSPLKLKSGGFLYLEKRSR